MIRSHSNRKGVDFGRKRYTSYDPYVIGYVVKFVNFITMLESSLIQFQLETPPLCQLTQ